MSKIEWFEKHYAISILIGLFLFYLFTDKSNSKKPDNANTSPKTTIAATATAKATATPKPTVAPTPAPLKISASKLYNEYAKNEVAADIKFKGKKVEVSGVVNKIGKDILNSSYVTIAEPLKNVQCFFDNDKLAELGNLNQGNSIVIEGTCKGKMGNVLIYDCIIKK